MHVLRQVVMPAAILASRARAFPAAKGLETRPGACCRSLRAVDVVHARLDVIKVPIDSSSEP